jgi:tRNA-binding protein
MGQASPQIGYEDFERVDIRIGTVIEASPFPEARTPAYRLTIDFGPEIGIKKSSAQVTKHYGLGELIGRRVAAVVNFPPRQIGPMKSEVLCLGFPDAEGGVVLVDVDRDVPNGGKLFWSTSKSASSRPPTSSPWRSTSCCRAPMGRRAG